MQTDDMILAETFCMHHKIELSFINSLSKSGLIQVTQIDQQVFVPAGQLNDLEKMARLKYDLDINIEGIETISHLLNHIKQMQQHIVHLTNRLEFYESE